MKKKEVYRLFLMKRQLKIFIRMKFLALFLLAFTLQMQATVYSQEVKVSLEFEHATFKEVVRTLKHSTGYTFLYQDKQVKGLRPLTIQCRDMELSELLTAYLKDSGLTYKVVDQTIIISPAEKTSVSPQEKQMTVTGKVLDKKKEPIVGATILLKGTHLGVASGVDGSFSISFPAIENPVLLVSFIGMISKEIAAQSDKKLEVILEEAVEEMDEVVVTGIFTKAKESYTGAVSSISEKELKTFKGQNLLATLRNIDPSINIMSNNEWGSNPNKVPELTIRGNSSLPVSINELNEGASQQLNAPLVILDGFEISLQKLMDLNDEEVAGVTILKDASATAIYGSRGANGVIVITTKSPQPGKLNITAQLGLNLEMPDLSSYDLLNAAEKLELERVAGIYENLKNSNYHLRLQEQYNRKLADVLSGVDTYWLSKPLRVGTGARANLRAEGGGEEFRWSVSLGYNNVQGVMKESKRDNFNGSLTISYYLNKLIFKNQLMIDFNKGVESKYGVFSDYAKMNPYWAPKDKEGNYIPYYEGNSSYANPLYNAQLNIVDQSKYNTITNNFSIEWMVLPELTLRGRLGLSKEYTTSDKFLPPSHTKFSSSTYKSGDGFFRKGSYEYSTGEGYSIDGSLTLNYNKTLNQKHQLYGGLDLSMAEEKEHWYEMVAEGFSDDDLSFFPNALQYAESTKPDGGESLSRRIGFTGNFTYTYDNRYFVDLSFRVDGASQFGTKNKFAPFWSAGVGWNLHREKFMETQDIFNNLRLKLSYGRTGSQQFNAYQALSTFSYYTGKRDIIWNGAELMGFGNENLKWQTTDKLNVGLEFGLFNNRISGAIDVYSDVTDALLSQMDVQLATGFPSYIDNIGQVKKEGFEVMLSGYVIRNTNKDMIWSITGKIAHNKNTIKKLSDAMKRQTEAAMKENVETNKLLFEGRSQNAIYAVPSWGIDPSTGKEIFLDANGEPTYTWNPSAKVYCGDAEPKYWGNISTLFSYKDLSLNLSFAYKWGGQQYNETLMKKVEVSIGTIREQNVDKRVYTDRWQEVGDVKFFKGYSSSGTKMTTRFVMDENVFEFQSASLQYQWHTPFVREKLGFRNINFSINMSDIFYISSIKRERGIEYPFARRIQLGLSCMF